MKKNLFFFALLSLRAFKDTQNPEKRPPLTGDLHADVENLLPGGVFEAYRTVQANALET